MRKIMLIILVVLLPASAGAIDVTVLGVVQDGSIRSNASYYAFGGKATPDNPAFENRYFSEYSAQGAAALAQQNSFAGNIKIQEQFEVQKGFGSFVTKVGTGVLINTPREPIEGQEATLPIIDGNLRMNAAGFGGRFSGPGVVLSTFDTTNGLKGTSEAEVFNGQFRAGAIQKIEIGSNEQPIKAPTTIEYQEAHWRFDGQFKVKVEIIFPK